MLVWISRLGLITLFILLVLITKPALARTTCLVSSLDSISGEITQSVRNALETATVLPVVDCFAITNVTHLSENTYLVSLTGISDYTDLANWNELDNGVWFGVVALQRHISGVLNGTIQGTQEFDEMIQDFPLKQDAKDALEGGGTVGSDYSGEPMAPAANAYFPFYNGYTAIYGTLGVHPHGDNWKAVDFLANGGGGTFPNAIYAAAPGMVTHICRDGTQLGLRIGSFYYLHLNDNASIQEGQYFVLHQYIGSLVKGNFNDDCGGASQQPSYYHLHFAFGNTGTLRLENWYLDTGTEKWTYGSVTRSPGQLIGPADWNGVFPPPPTEGPPSDETPTPGPSPTPGGPVGPPVPGSGNDGTNFWTYITDGLKQIAQAILSIFPTHQDLALASTIGKYAILAINIVYVSSIMNYAVAFIILAPIPILETIRIAIAIWLWAKRLVYGF